MALERHEVCVLLDKLTLDMLHLMEERVKCQINIENSTNNANIQLAKSRYIMGHNNVSAVQIPTEGSSEFSALSTVERSISSDTLNEEALSLHTRKSQAETEYINPVKWFGVLVPQNLYQAQNMFMNTLQYIVESVNVQRQLHATYRAISRLKQMKINLTPEE